MTNLQAFALAGAVFAITTMIVIVVAWVVGEVIIWAMNGLRGLGRRQERRAARYWAREGHDS